MQTIAFLVGTGGSCLGRGWGLSQRGWKQSLVQEVASLGACHAHHLGGGGGSRARHCYGLGLCWSTLERLGTLKSAASVLRLGASNSIFKSRVSVSYNSLVHTVISPTGFSS